jgi:transcriptional regulator with XRE-family HTH domain
MFKDKLKELRKQKNLTQEELAVQISISRQSISKWENGLSYPTKPMAEQLCLLFEIPMEELLNQEEVMWMSIENNTKVQMIRMRSKLIFSSVFIVLITIGIVLILLNQKVNRLEPTNQTPEVNETLLGFIVLDEVASQNYHDDHTQLMTIIESKLYPYDLYFIDESHPYNESNRLFDVISSNGSNHIEVQATVIINRNNDQIITIYSVYWDTETNQMYLDNGNSMRLNLNQTANLQIEGKPTDAYNKSTLYDITLTSRDELESIEMDEHDASNQFISRTVLEANQTHQFNPNTLFFVITETYTDIDNQFYLQKTIGEYPSVNRYYNFTYAYFDSSLFAIPQTIMILTDL